MQLSPLIIGTMRWGLWGANFSLKEMQQIIEKCLDEGLFSFDHADIYGDYTTEKQFGDAFSQMNIPRGPVHFISKCGIEMPSPNRNYQLKTYNYSKEHILKSVDQSLQNLKTDYLDVLLLHRPSPLMNPEEVAESFELLLAQEKVRQFGVSNFSVSQFELLNSSFPLITNQIEISINQTQSFYNGTLDQLMMKKLRPMAWSVMGNYFTENSEQNHRIRKVLDELYPKYEATENQILLAFILKHPAHIYPVVGTSKMETITELRAGLELKLEREDWFKLLEASAGKEVD